MTKVILSTAVLCLWAAVGAIHEIFPIASFCGSINESLAYASEEIKFTAAVDKTEYKTGEPILITFTLKNEYKSAVYVNKRFAIGSESVPRPKQDVCLSGTSPFGEKLTSAYNYEAGLPKTDDFVLLKPGKEVKSDSPRNLEGLFEFNEPGTYKITAVYRNFFGQEIGLEVFKDPLTSQPISFVILSEAKNLKAP